MPVIFDLPETLDFSIGGSKQSHRTLTRADAVILKEAHNLLAKIAERVGAPVIVRVRPTSQKRAEKGNRGEG